MIRFESVSFAYDPLRPLLDALDLELGAGLTLVVGANGSGKSTLLKLAAGIEPPDRGRVLIDGRDLWKDEAAARRSLAYVPEQPDLTPYAAIRDILGLVARLRGEPPRAAAEALAAAGLEGLGGRSVRELSLGQKRRATFAAAFIGRPAHLLLDEPLDAMDPAMRETIRLWLERRLAEGASAVVISHEIDPFAGMAARTLDMEKTGRVPGSGKKA
jgi:ABC-type multidrug transport system ATPase subunit